MERKIGEIFEYNGEWYQCVKQPEDFIGEVCKICAFHGTENCDIDECSDSFRSDKQDAIFKKIEKVGEPIIYMSRTFQRLKSSDAEQCKYCYFGNQVCNPQLCGKESFLVEIKQNKEDMERQIGEIFEYCGDFYQVVKEECACSNCAFLQKDCSINPIRPIRGECTSSSRSDQGVIFRKLEKVGEPFTVGRELCQHYKVFDIDNVCGDVSWNVHNYKAKTILIELKQNKDMKTVKVSKDDLNFLINKIRYGILPEYTDCDAIIAEITDLFSVEDVDLSNTEKIGKNLKKFDLEAAKSGKPVCTRDGRKARIICFDRTGKLPVVALVETDGKEDVYFYLNCGKDNENVEKEYDLVMLPEKKEGWVNLYRDEESKRVYCGECIFSERENAKKHYECNDTKVATVPIRWEE